MGTSSVLTTDVLRTRRYNRLAYVLVFEGLGLAFTTDADVAGLAEAWDLSDWQLVASGGKGESAFVAKWYTGLFYPGSYKQEIEPFAPRIRGDSIGFKILDPLGTLELLLGGGARSPASCYLTADLAPNGLALVTSDTASFATAHPAGTYPIYIGGETLLVDAANRTANGWSNALRGAYSLTRTNGGSSFRRYHRINRINGLLPKVTDTPRIWFNRGVALYLHHYEEGVGWNDDSKALLVWQGRIKSFERATRAFDFTAVSTTELLNTQVMDEQFTAKLSAQGRYITQAMAQVWCKEYVPAVARTDGIVGQLATYDAQVTAAILVRDIEKVLLESSSGLRYGWTCGLGNDNKIRIQFTTKGFDSPKLEPQNRVVAEIGLHPLVWKMLGFSANGVIVKEIAGARYSMHIKRLSYIGADGLIGKWEIHGDQAPLVFDFTRVEGVTQKIQLEAIRGTWKPQDVVSTGEGTPSLAESFLQVGDIAIFQGYFVGAPNNYFVVTQDVTSFFSSLGFAAKPSTTSDGPGQIRAGEAGEYTVKQVWYERAPVRQLALRLILSTGVTGWNHATWDQNAFGMGCEFPASLLDADAFNRLGEGDTYTLLLNQPTECNRILESLFASYGRHLVWRQGLVTLVEPRSDGPTIAVAWTLNENNKAVIGERIRESVSAEGIINRVEIKAFRKLDGSFTDMPPIEDMVSASDFGQRRALSLEAWGVDPQGQGWQLLIAKMASKPLAYFSRPLTVLERSYDVTLIQIAPGDTVLLSDNEALDPRTGLKGLVNFPCWVLSTDFDYSAMRGTVRLAYNAELYADKICAWAPTVRVDHTAANAGYVVVSGTVRYLQCNPYLYGFSPEGSNVERYNVNDVIAIRELSPVDPFALLGFSGVVQSVDVLLSRIYLTAAIVGWDTSKKYIVTPGGWSAPIQQSQKRDVFIAGLTDSVNGPSIPTAYLWGGQKGQAVTATPFAAQKFVRPPRSTVGDWLWRQGSPLAVGDYYELLYGLNSMLAHRTKQQAHMGAWTHGAAVTTGVGRELLIGPAKVPLYGWGRRPLRVRLFAKTGGASGTIYITTSRTMPKGLSNVAVVFDDDVISFASFTLSNVAYAWQAEQVVACVPEPGFSQGYGPPFVWLTIEGQIAAGAINIQGISAGEGALP